MENLQGPGRWKIFSHVDGLGGKVRARDRDQARDRASMHSSFILRKFISLNGRWPDGASRLINEAVACLIGKRPSPKGAKLRYLGFNSSFQMFPTLHLNASALGEPYRETPLPGRSLFDLVNLIP